MPRLYQTFRRSGGPFDRGVTLPDHVHAIGGHGEGLGRVGEVGPVHRDLGLLQAAQAEVQDRVVLGADVAGCFRAARPPPAPRRASAASRCRRTPPDKVLWDSFTLYGEP